MEYWKWTVSNKQIWKEYKKFPSERENLSRQNPAEIMSSYKQRLNTSCEILWAILKMDKELTKAYKPEGKMVINDASERWHWNKLYIQKRSNKKIYKIEDHLYESIRELND